MARCAVRAAYQRRKATSLFAARITSVPPAGTRAGTSQRDVPTWLRVMARESKRVLNGVRRSMDYFASNRLTMGKKIARARVPTMTIRPTIITGSKIESSFFTWRGTISS